MGKKKDKLKARTQAEEGGSADATEPPQKKQKGAIEADAAQDAKDQKQQRETTQASGGDDKGAGCQRREDVFSAAAVVFFTRNKEGKPCRVLVALEERKVQASYIGLPQKGKITQRMLLFPMGRREKKDKNDTVETAKREYIEETGDFGGLAQYLDFADFEAAEDGKDADQPTWKPDLAHPWTGRNNMAVYFAPAGMIVLFCEVPVEASKATHRAAVAGVPNEVAEARAAAAKAEEEAEAKPAAEGKDAKKKKKKPEQTKPSPSYHVGRTDHADAHWIDAAELRAAMENGERSPSLAVDGQECRVFPTVASVLRLEEAREWLGVKRKVSTKKE